MSDPERAVLDARARLDTATRQRARAEAAYEAATANLNNLHRVLKEEFGLDSEAAGVTRLGELEQQLRAVLDAVSAKLDEAGV